MKATFMSLFAAGFALTAIGCGADTEGQASSQSHQSSAAGSGAVPIVMGGPGSSLVPGTLGAAGQTSTTPSTNTLPRNTLPASGNANGNTPPIGGTPAVTTPAGGSMVPPAGTMEATPGTAMTPPMVMTTSDPVIPEIKGECPSLETGPINYMGADGQVESGPMPSSPTAPMLIYWHGTGSSSGEYAFMAAAIAQGVTSQGGVIVSFQGTTNQGDCSPSGTFVFCTGDYDVIDQYVACAVKNRNVDPHRIYTAGCSAGGLMSTNMAMLRSQYIAAAAPNSGGLAIPGAFSSDHTPALMTVHGAPGSDVVGVDFSQTSATADMIFKQRGGFVIDCNTGGGHCGGGGLAGDAWKFLQAHPFGVDPEPWDALPAGFSDQCMMQ